MKNIDTINKLIQLEKKYFKYFYKSDFDFRESITMRIFNEVIKKNSIFTKKIKSMKICFPYSSKISSEFLLSHEKSPDHIWEPQTHKLLNLLCKNGKNVIFGGAFFGDHACLLAKKFSKTKMYCFEPVKKQRMFLRKNKMLNNLNNLFISDKALFNKKNLKLYIKENKIDDGDISLVKQKNKDGKYFLTETLDHFSFINKMNAIEILMIDVEGNELNVLLGAIKLLKDKKIKNIIFEIHSKYVNWSKGLIKTKIIKLLLKLGYKVFVIRDYHSNKKMKNKIELLNLKKTFLKGPTHGFNLIATL